MASDRNTAIKSEQILKHTLQQDDLSPDALVWQEPVEDKDLTTPPGGESEGDRYLVISGGSGTDWAGEDNKIAQYVNSSWNFYTPQEGWFVWINDENKLYRFNGSSWGEFIGSATPGGSDTQVQYNDNDSFGGDSAFVFDDTFGNIKLTLNGKILTRGIFDADMDTGVEVSQGWVDGDKIRFKTAGTERWQIDDNGNLLPGINNTFEIGSDALPVKEAFIEKIKLSDNIEIAGIDNFTIKVDANNYLKIADRIELNTMLNAFRIAINGSLSQFGMTDGLADEFEDESGVDTGASTNEDYDSSNDLYKPTQAAVIELDYFEYANDGVAQAAYVSSDTNETLLIEQAGEDEYSIQGDDGGSEWRRAQSFTLTETTLMTSVAIAFGATTGSPTGNVTYRIETTVSEVPTGTLADVNGTVAFVPSASGWNKQSFATPFTLTAGVYAIALANDNQSNGDYWTVGQANSDIYAGGKRCYSLDGGAWVGHTKDMTFRVYGNTHLQCYSEDTIKEQGSYSLKVVALQTDSLNDTLTQSGLSIDLTDKDELKIDFYASRTGTNLQIQIHDSGGTTSTKDIVISSADTWETTTWDISGISNANKDDIDSIIIKIINADADNTFYVDNFFAPGLINNMTLISDSFTAESAPEDARIVLFEEDVDSITENTDIKAYVSRDGGTTFSQVTLSDEGDYETGKRILTGVVDISGQPSGTSVEWKVETLNNKDLKLHGVGLHWD